MTEPNDSYVLIGHFAERCGGVHTRTITRWEARGLLPPRVRIGPRLIGYPAAAVDRFLANVPTARRGASAGSASTSKRRPDGKFASATEPPTE